MARIMFSFDEEVIIVQVHFEPLTGHSPLLVCCGLRVVPEGKMVGNVSDGERR